MGRCITPYNFYSIPETVGDFLKEHSLSKYADALEEHGWNSLSHLQAISDHGLQQLIADVAMPSGHAARLRNALGKPSAATAAPPTMPGAVPAAPAATAASQPGQEAAACALDAAGSAELQKKLHIVAPPLQENPAALLMRAAPPRRRAPAATCCPEPRLCRLKPANERWSTRFA